MTINTTKKENTMNMKGLLHAGWLIGWLEFNVPFQHKYGYIRDEIYWVTEETKPNVTEANIRPEHKNTTV